MIKTLQNTLKQDKEHLSVPKSVQDTIPIRRLWPDGLFQFGGKFSKTVRFSDINYAIASKEDKTSMFLGYSELLNALDTGSTTKITINNKRLNRRNFEQEILIPPQGDHLDGGRSEYNAMLLDKVTDSSNSMVQERYVTVSAHMSAFPTRAFASVTARRSYSPAESGSSSPVRQFRCASLALMPWRRSLAAPHLNSIMWSMMAGFRTMTWKSSGTNSAVLLLGRTVSRWLSPM